MTPLCISFAICVVLALVAALVVAAVAAAARPNGAAAASLMAAATTAAAIVAAGAAAIAAGPAARYGGARPKVDVPPKPEPTRGAEIDAAAAARPPAAVLRDGLPPDFQGAFDVDADGRPVAAADGLYFGVSRRDDPARATLLTPRQLRWAALVTSGRRYAYVLVDSPEACYAVRAAPAAGRVRELDADALVADLRPLLRGVPPHKLPLDEYLAWARGGLCGAEVEVGRRSHAEVRFDLIDITTAAERAAAVKDLVAIADFDALDWSAYDAVVAPLVREAPVESAGDVTIDLAARTVAVPKARRGVFWASMPHSRSYVTFHTHPAARYQGAAYEQPSDGDLLHVLSRCVHKGLVWHFVSAPEGVYILRPSAALAAFYGRDPEAAWAAVRARYAPEHCVGGVAVCAAAAVEALRDAGFVAHFRAAPCVELAAGPDLAPLDNARARRAAREDFAAHAALPPSDLLAADWSAVVAACRGAPGLQVSSWLRARCAGGAVQPLGSGHGFGPPADPQSYPLWAPGPLLVFYVADADFPARVPQAAIDAARERHAEWPWLAFLSDRRVLVFRADATGAETHGPRPLGGKEVLSS